MKIKRSDIVKTIANEIGITQKKASAVLSVLLQTIESELAQKGKFSIRNFGKFYTVTKKPRNIRHPLTGQIIRAEKKNIIKFKCGKALENEMNIIDWCCANPNNRDIFQQIYDLIEDSEIENKDEDEAMYYPGKRVHY